MMNDVTLLAPIWLWLLLLIPLWLLLGFYQKRRNISTLSSFRTQATQSKIQWLNGSLILLTIVFLSLALARPGWDPKAEGSETHGRDVIFLLDVSRSMLADDARPNRLEVARQAILQTVRASKTDRFGLVAFAGSASIQSPLTNDKLFFTNIVEQINSNSVAQGGTRIEDALFKVLDKMISKNSDSRSVDIILISDGEDLGSKPERALDNLDELGVRLIVIGLGDSEFGARVPSRVGAGWVFVDGRELWSKMDINSLRELALGVEQGMFFPIGSATFDLPQIMEKLRQVWPSQSQETGDVITYTEGYPACLLIALLALLTLVLRGRTALTAGLFIIAFNSQAFSSLPENEVVSSQIRLEQKSELIADTSLVNENILPEQNTEQEFIYDESYLASLSLIAQQRLAQSLFIEEPESAAFIYRYIAEHSEQYEVVVQANYNLATSLIFAAEQLSADIELYGVDEEEEADPEYYYDEAEDLLRLVVLAAPKHRLSRNNLEWLTYRKQGVNDPDSEQEQQQQDQISEQQDDPEAEPESEEESNSSEPDPEQQLAKKQDENQELADNAMQMSNISLPPPAATPEEILHQANQRNRQERAPKQKKQKSVSRDW